MMLDWADFPDAPAPGTRLCGLDQLPDSGVVSIDPQGFPVLLARLNGAVVAYVNACPHQFLPLDLRQSDILSTDAAHLMCSNHAALFRLSDGVGTAGEGLGCALSAIPVVLRDGGIWIKG